jgi:hypothetical protein
LINQNNVLLLPSIIRFKKDLSAGVIFRSEKLKKQKSTMMYGAAINQSQITTKKTRNTREQLTLKLSSIRSMMLDGATNTKIMSTLNIPQRTFYRYMDKIYQQKRIELAKKNKETLATHILLLRERMLQSIRNCQNIALDPKVSAKDRIQAERLKLETSIAIVKLEVEGTTITLHCCITLDHTM